jgi:hypothetical protein
MQARIANGQAIATLPDQLTAALYISHIILMLALLLSACLVCLLISHSRRLRQTVRDLPGDDRASASLEFLLVLFPLLVIVLAVWQLAFMLNAQVHVGYAAYSAARSASTVAYMDLPDEPEGILLNASEPDAEKWQRIQRAAIPGTLAISPGSPESAARAYLSSKASTLLAEQAAPDFDALDLAALPGRLSLMTIHRGDAVLQGTRLARAIVKAVYAESATRVIINGRDARGNLDSGGQASDTFDLSGEDTLQVTVEYDFWLNVPYAGRMMYLAFGGNELLDDQAYPTLTLRQTVSTPAWPKVAAY